MVWNYFDDDIKDVVSPIELVIKRIDKSKVLVHHYRVDQQFSNSFEKWNAMGKPQQVTSVQYKELETAGQLQLVTSTQWTKVNNGKMMLHFDLPCQGVSLIRLTWASF